MAEDAAVIRSYLSVSHDTESFGLFFFTCCGGQILLKSSCFLLLPCLPTVIGHPDRVEVGSDLLQHA